MLAEGESNDLWAVDLEKVGIEIRVRNQVAIYVFCALLMAFILECICRDAMNIS